jgi:hypothetical protein
MDGSLSTLAPIFAVVLATHRPLTAFFTGLATALGAGVSMAFSEGLSDTGDLTGRGTPVVRGAITGLGTFLGGVFHAPVPDPRLSRRHRRRGRRRGVELCRSALRALAFHTSFGRSFVGRRRWRGHRGLSSALGVAAG